MSQLVKAPTPSELVQTMCYSLTDLDQINALPYFHRQAFEQGQVDIRAGSQVRVLIEHFALAISKQLAVQAVTNGRGYDN